MDWIRVTVYTTTFGTDAVCDCLMTEGISGFEIDDESEFNDFLENNTKYWDYVDDELINSKKGETKVKFYVQNGIDANETLLRIADALKQLKNTDFKMEGVHQSRLRLPS